MIKRKKRIYLISLFFLTIASSIYLILWALRDNIVFFYSPSEIQQKINLKEIDEMSKLRLGGMVKESSIEQLNNGSINFIITDFDREMVEALIEWLIDCEIEKKTLNPGTWTFLFLSDNRGKSLNDIVFNYHTIII